MRVQVQPINVNGKPLFKKERDKREIFVGELKIFENRMHSLGRAVVTAQVIDPTGGTDTPTCEIYDVTILFAEKTKIRLRGFEMVLDVQYAQTWDVEVI